jgi:hypothetical protein
MSKSKNGKSDLRFCHNRFLSIYGIGSAKYLYSSRSCLRMKPFFKLSWILLRLLREPSLVRLMNEKDLRNSYFLSSTFHWSSTLLYLASEIGFALA